MQNIEFLPQRYRDKDARRKVGVWRLAVVALLGGLVAAAALFQFRQKQQVRDKIDQAQPLYLAAQTKAAQLQQLQSVLASEQAKATLCAYLQHPWPRTQLLAAVAGAMPEGISINRIQIGGQQISPRRTSRTSESEEQENEEAAVEPAVRDMMTLKAASNERVVMVVVVGTATDAEKINTYLKSLSESPFIGRVDLDSLENNETPTGNGQLRFTAKGVIRAADKAIALPKRSNDDKIAQGNLRHSAAGR